MDNIQTSISDYDKYKNICKLACWDDSVFETFRSHEDYIGVLEHVSEHTGYEYLHNIMHTNKFEINDEIISKILQIDRIGKSNKYNFPQFGMLSPTILRYLSIYTDIMKLYGSLNNKIIVEIGAGYGGQAMLINMFADIHKYIIVDLPEVIPLVQKFLTKNNLDMSKFVFYSLENLPVIDSDFVLSNYAFSECYKSIQDIYIEKIINKCKNFYMICNFISPDLVYSKDELLSVLHGNVKVIDENPCTSTGNLLFYK